MENKNEIQVVNITGDIATTVTNPVDMCKKMTLQQKMDLVTILKFWTKKSKKDPKPNFFELMQKDIFDSNEESWLTTLPNGDVWKNSINREKETTTVVKHKKRNYEKAIQYAKDNNLPIPMTERVVIEPKVDYIKLESMPWFQEHLKDFIEVVEETETKHSTNQIVQRQIKNGGEK